VAGPSRGQCDTHQLSHENNNYCCKIAIALIEGFWALSPDFHTSLESEAVKFVKTGTGSSLSLAGSKSHFCKA